MEDMLKPKAASSPSIGTDEEISKKIDSGSTTTTTSSSHSIATTSTSPGPTMTTTDQQHLEFLLTVPFYVYEEFLHDENILNITDMVTLGFAPYDNFDDFLESRKYHKHSGDLHFIRSALDHPM